MKQTDRNKCAAIADSTKRTERYLKDDANDKLREAGDLLDTAFNILNNLAYDDGSIMNIDQIAVIQRAMDQISHASDNTIKALD